MTAPGSTVDGGLPADDSLPFLTAVARHGSRALLAPHGLEPTGVLRVLSHHPGRRIVLGDDGGLIVKAYARHPAGLVEALRSLERAGLTGPEPPLATRLV